MVRRGDDQGTAGEMKGIHHELASPLSVGIPSDLSQSNHY